MTFDRLSTEERTERLGRLGEEALRRYGITGAVMTPISTAWNTVFRIDTAAGDRYVLRVCLPYYTESDARGEVAWMQAVGRETEIRVPEAIETEEGDIVVVASTSEVPEPRVCLLFSFVEAKPIDEPTPEDCLAWGEITALLHEHGSCWKPPVPIDRPTFSTPFPFRFDRVVLFTDEWKEMMAPYHDLFHAALERAQSAIDELYGDRSSGPILLHNDLHLWNLLRGEEGYTVIDFEDIMWGFPVQDAGVALYYIAGRPDASDILAKYREGYTRHRPWFERYDGELDGMIVVRELSQFNLVLQLFGREKPERVAKMLPKVGKRIRSWLETGRISGLR